MSLGLQGQKGGASSERVWGTVVSGNYFTALGVTTLVVRLFPTKIGFQIRGREPISPHLCQKMFLNAGVPPERVATLLGHRSPAIALNFYAACIPERQSG